MEGWNTRLNVTKSQSVRPPGSFRRVSGRAAEDILCCSDPKEQSGGRAPLGRISIGYFLLKRKQRQRVNIFMGKKYDFSKGKYLLIPTHQVGGGGIGWKGFIQYVRTKWSKLFHKYTLTHVNQSSRGGKYDYKNGGGGDIIFGVKYRLIGLEPFYAKCRPLRRKTCYTGIVIIIKGFFSFLF